MTDLDLDKLEAAARAEIEARSKTPTTHELGRVRETWHDYFKQAQPESVLALIERLRAAEAKVEGVRKVHFGKYVPPGSQKNWCAGCGHPAWPCPTIEALGEES